MARLPLLPNDLLKPIPERKTEITRGVPVRVIRGMAEKVTDRRRPMISGRSTSERSVPIVEDP